MGSMRLFIRKDIPAILQKLVFGSSKTTLSGQSHGFQIKSYLNSKNILPMTTMKRKMILIKMEMTKIQELQKCD